MTDADRECLRRAHDHWLLEVGQAGPMHANWELIFNARAHLDGEPDYAVMSLSDLLERAKREFV